MKFKFLIILIPVMLLFTGCRNEHETKEPLAVIPKPLALRQGSGYFRISPETKVLFEPSDNRIREVAGFFTAWFEKASGIKLELVEAKSGKKQNGISFSLLQDADTLRKEGYMLEVTQKYIQLEAVTPEGLFRGLQTLLQVLPVEIYGSQPVQNVEWKIPVLKMYDKPLFSWRGMHLDVSRHFFPKEFIKRYIDLIAMHKMNIFHWHLTDDNGWRIQIDKYPLLTDIAAWRVDRENMPWDEVTPPKPGEKATYGGFYTKADIREIVKYASDRYITVIPEIEMPGHSCEVLAAYPELSCTGGPFYVQPGSYWPNIDILCAGNEQTFSFMEDVLDEVAGLFPAPYIHIGGDEATKTRWENCPKCQKRIRDEGLKNEHELQSYFIKRIEQYLISKGKRMIGWDEILEGGLAPEATVMSWRGFDGGIEAARQGHDVIMSPVSHCYLDYYQANPDYEPKAIGGFTTLKKVYSFDPVPPELTSDERKYILGGQGNVWTEFIATPDYAEYMSLPRMTALAEILWTPKEKQSWQDFRNRLNTQFKRFDAMKISYSKGSYAVDFVTTFDQDKNEFRIAMATEQSNPEIRYALNDSMPSPSSPVYSQPLLINKTTTLSAAIFEDGKMKEAPSVKTLIFHLALGSDVKYLTRPNSRYPGNGDKTLVDGIKGSPNHGDGLWQGFYGDDLEVELDLGDEKTISLVKATSLQRWRSWIFLPGYMEVSLSQDGKTYSAPAKYLNSTPADKDGRFIEEFKVEINKMTARYVKIKAGNIGVCPPWHDGKGQKAWIFVDEIVVE